MGDRDGNAVTTDMVVAVAYTLQDEAGTVVDARSAEEPMTFVQGHAQVLPGLESGLDGAVAGERRTLRLGPEEAFGERDEEALLEVDRHDFPGGEGASVGDEVVATGEDGVELSFVVVDVSDETILIDRNHPLAGQTVTFEVEVLSVRPATDAELDAAHEELAQHVAYESAIGYGSSPPTTADGDDSAGLIPLRTKG